MKPHIIYAHQYWEKLVKPGDTVIDATVGNGYDTLFLAKLLQGEGRLIGYDIQPQALNQTKKTLESLPYALSRNITLKLQSHVFFEESEIKLIVYNLGYLPRGDKRITTTCSTTLESIQSGLSALSREGAISITCYPGHAEGAKEQIAILDFLKGLARISHTFSGNSRTLTPDLGQKNSEVVLIHYCPHYPVGQSQASKRRFASKKCEKCGLGRQWQVCHHTWINSPLSPSLIWLQALRDS